MEMLKFGYQKIKGEGQKLEKEARERVVGYIVATFGLVAGLAWNDTVKSLIEHFFPQTGDSLVAKFGYAIGVTLVVVIVTLYLMRLVKRD